MIEFLQTPDQGIWARWQGRALCSARDPRREARAWAESLAIPAGTPAVDVVGIGLGYHLFAFAEQFPGLRIRAFDTKDLNPDSFPEPLCGEFQNAQKTGQLRCVWGKADCQQQLREPQAGLTFRFRAACGVEEDQLFEALCARSPQAFQLTAKLRGYDFQDALQDFPEDVAIAIKSLRIQALAPESNEAKLLGVLRELVR